MLCTVILKKFFGAVWKFFDGKFDGPFGIPIDRFNWPIFMGKISEGKTPDVAA